MLFLYWGLNPKSSYWATVPAFFLLTFLVDYILKTKNEIFIFFSLPDYLQNHKTILNIFIFIVIIFFCMFNKKLFSLQQEIIREIAYINSDIVFTGSWWECYIWECIDTAMARHRGTKVDFMLPMLTKPFWKNQFNTWFTRFPAS